MDFYFSLSVAASDFKKKVTFVQLFPRPSPDDPYEHFFTTMECNGLTNNK